MIPRCKYIYIYLYIYICTYVCIQFLWLRISRFQGRRIYTQRHAYTRAHRCNLRYFSPRWWCLHCPAFINIYWFIVNNDARICFSSQGAHTRSTLLNMWLEFLCTGTPRPCRMPMASLSFSSTSSVGIVSQSWRMNALLCETFGNCAETISTSHATHGWGA